MNFVRRAALACLSAIAVLSLGLGLGLGLGLKTSASAVCNALADAVAARLDEGLLEDQEAFEQQLADAGLLLLEVVKASPASVDKTACVQPTPTLAVTFAFSLGGEVEGLLSSDAANKLRTALAALTGWAVRPEDVSLSVVAGSVDVSGIIHMTVQYTGVANYVLTHLLHVHWGRLRY
jgi:hypothetical protein